MRRFTFLAVLLLWFGDAVAHDPSAWGGLFRSRDDGATWLPVDAGLFIGGALAVAISPTDPNHLLYATDTRLLRSHNGGRDWTPEAADTLVGPTLAVAFGRDGVLAIASGSGGLFRTMDGRTWQRARAPGGAVPASEILAASGSGAFYLAGPEGVYTSRDGSNWKRAGAELPEQAPAALAVDASTTARLACIIDNGLWASSDGGAHWTRLNGPWSAHGLETVGFGSAGRRELWVVADDRVVRSDDDGASWHRVGDPIGAGDHAIHRIATASDGKVILLTTNRGMLRSADGGASWPRLEGVMPIHLESGPLMADPVDARTFYAGFSLTPYAEVYRHALENRSVLARFDPVTLAGGGALLLLVLIGGTIGARRLLRRRR